MGRKAYENLPGVGMRWYVKFESEACRNVIVMPGQTARQTDELVFIILLDCIAVFFFLFFFFYI